MSKLLVEDENVKSSKSSFAIYTNEQIKFEGKDISPAAFAYKMQSGFFQAIDIEIINAVYILKYSTSRQITTFLNSVKNIDIDQNIVTRRLTILNNSSVVGRYSFISDNRNYQTGLKCYVLRERGKRLLLQREYPCNWTIFNSVLVLESIKNYLARNNYILKVLKNKIIDFDNLKLNNDETIVGCNYTVNNFRHVAVSMRKTDSINNLKKTLIQFEKDYGSLNNKRIVIIGEDDLHLFDVFKNILLLIQKKEIDVKFLNIIIFTQDLRILEREIDSCFIIYKIVDKKAVLEDFKINEFIYDINN
ncbi:hypothetical protein GKZ28_08020 [Clostridium chromiireducens]|jgi:hypothetical protein|uniref:Uncharacterized protein n=1 Tax=Clostridium chromiireducens TaxID=225345 RepID=A0A964W1Y4_9CLOT|nr:hypothetical protein [Clostridium chromiireducens]MVX63640.1 hypothetical protein [Clostridium chromiireducens]